MSKQEAIALRNKAIALAGEQRFDESRAQWQEGYRLLEAALEVEREDIDLWDLRLDFLGNGASPLGDADCDQLRLEAAENLVRLNPDDSDAPFHQPYSGDYGGNAGLYYQLFSILYDIGSFDDDWPNNAPGRRATEAIRLALKYRPADEEFLREEAEAAKIAL